MSYVRDKIQILGGGFNLLPPGDKTPKTDYLLAQNWRTDRDGRLLSRWGYPRKFSIPSMAYAHSGACSGGIEGDFYIAANNGAGAGSIFYNPNISGVPILTGLSGGRVGMVTMNGWTWIMDPLKQQRHNPASGVMPWGCAAPATACVPAAGDPLSGGPAGTYNFYCTFMAADESYETNPGPESAAVTVDGEIVNFSAVPQPSGPLMGGLSETWIYAIGGTLTGPYLCAKVAKGTFTGSWNTNDLTITNEGTQMPTTHGLPPAASGMCGPYFSRLYAWAGSRLFYTDPTLPQYWPGADDPTGNWVDVGQDGEDIIWVTSHSNTLLIYKERSIWYLSGDPDTGTLERLEDGTGLVNPFAVVNAGAFDYFVAPNSLRRCVPNLGRTEDISGELRPLFNGKLANSGPLTTPGAILPGPAEPNCYAVSLGYAMGKLYVSYQEKTVAGASAMLLVYSESDKRWMYHRNGLDMARFFGFLFDGIMMQGLTGADGWAHSFNLDDFRVLYMADEPPAGGLPQPITCVYQSHFEDVGLPDQEKCWLQVTVDALLTGDTGAVYVAYDNGTLVLLGTITGTGTRKQTSFTLGDDGTLAKNISVAVAVDATQQVELHNVYLSYYVEARLTAISASLPTDLGVPNVKQAKELMLDVDPCGGVLDVSIATDLPGNALAIRQTLTVPATTGRAPIKLPFDLMEGYLWRVVTKGEAGFREYTPPRLLMRVLGTYVEAYEAAAGFVWDSMQQSFESGLTHIPRTYAIALAAMPIKEFREISMEIDTFGEDVTVDFLTDLPGNSEAIRATLPVNTSGAGRRFVRVPLPAGVTGRLCRILISGTAKFVLFSLAVEVIAIGVFIESYEAAAGAVYDSRLIDLGSAKVKEISELELDIQTVEGPITATFNHDFGVPCVRDSVVTTGRQKVRIPLTLGDAPYNYPLARLCQLVLSGATGWALYGARAKVRELGTYLTPDEVLAGGVWDSGVLDLGTERVKDFKRLEFELQTEGPCTLNLYTDQAGALAQQFTTTVDTDGRRKIVRIPLPPGIRGRLLQIEIGGNAVRLFNGRVWMRPTNEAKAEWTWVSLPIEPTQPTWGWVPFPLTATEPQWFWAKVLAVDETPDKFEWVSVERAA